MITEQFTRRALAAVRIVDGVTGEPILAALSVTSPQSRWVRNRRGFYVLMDAPGLEAHQDAEGEPPPVPVVGSVSVTVEVRDWSGRYLPRLFTLRLPRDPDPGHAGDGASLFQPVDVRLYLSPSAPLSPAWAVIRASVLRAGSETPLGGALIRVLRSGDGRVLARGLSDQRGEAVVAVPGIPVTTWEEAAGPVMGTEVDVQVDVVWNPALNGFPDPDVLEADRDSLPRSQSGMKLASGRTVVRTVTVAIP